MANAEHAKGQSILEHGLSVWKHTKRLIDDDTTGFRLPDWYETYKSRIFSNIHPESTIREYTENHDCGKPRCLTIDSDGRNHYPNHAEISETLWREAGGSEDACRLIGMDMLFHTATPEQILSHPGITLKDICTLIITSLAELHANAELFGGMESDSFKIKHKKWAKRAKKVLFESFDHKYMYIVTRNDLSPSQKAVQSCHAAIEATKAFGDSIQTHPSVILCVVKSEHKLKALQDKLQYAGVDFTSFREPDIGDQLTAIASTPLAGADREIFKRYQLL